MKELIKHAKARYRIRVIRALMSVTGKSPEISRSQALTVWLNIGRETISITINVTVFSFIDHKLIINS